MMRSLPAQGYIPHEPVMANEIVDLLKWPGKDQVVLVDCTVGAAGHAMRLLSSSGPKVHLIGFDRDQSALALSTRRLVAFKDRFHPVHAPFSEFRDHVQPIAQNIGPIMGVLWDLGVSSMQLDQAERGFSFRNDGPVDMRMDTSTGITASELIEKSSVDELAIIIKEFGEEPSAKRVAIAIKEHAPYATTVELATTISEALPKKVVINARKKGINPATKTFQALRIAVNGELDQFSESLPQALDLLHPATLQHHNPATPEGNDAALVAVSSTGESETPPALLPSEDFTNTNRGGLLAVLSYHSLEDRLAKRFFQTNISPCVCPPNLPICGCLRQARLRADKRGLLSPSAEEIARNPRARSAKLRVAQKLPHNPA